MFIKVYAHINVFHNGWLHQIIHGNLTITILVSGPFSGGQAKVIYCPLRQDGAKSSAYLTLLHSKGPRRFFAVLRAVR